MHEDRYIIKTEGDVDLNFRQWCAVYQDQLQKEKDNGYKVIVEGEFSPFFNYLNQYINSFNMAKNPCLLFHPSMPVEQIDKSVQSAPLAETFFFDLSLCFPAWWQSDRNNFYYFYSSLIDHKLASNTMWFVLVGGHDDYQSKVWASNNFDLQIRCNKKAYIADQL